MNEGRRARSGNTVDEGCEMCGYRCKPAIKVPEGKKHQSRGRKRPAGEAQASLWGCGGAGVEEDFCVCPKMRAGKSHFLR